MREIGVAGIGLFSLLADNVNKHCTKIEKGNTIKFIRSQVDAIGVHGLDEYLQNFLPYTKMNKFMSSTSMLMALAAQEALCELDLSLIAPERIGLFAATGLASGNFFECLEALKNSFTDTGFSLAKFNRDGMDSINPLMCFKALGNMPPCIVSILHQIKGSHLLFHPFEDQGAAALYEGYHAVQNGEIEYAIILAADDPMHLANYTYFVDNNLFSKDDIPNPCGAAIVLSGSLNDSLCTVNSIDMHFDNAIFNDPIRNIVGRTVAPAALVQFILSMTCSTPYPQKISANGQTISWSLKK